MAPKEKFFFCRLCNLPYDSYAQFEEHQWSMLHHRHMENKKNEKTHFCALCKQSWPSLPDYGVHLISRCHKNAALQRLQILKKANLEPKIPNRQSNSFQFREPIERISSRNDERMSSGKDSAISMSERTPLSSSSASKISPETYGEISVRSSYQLTHVKDVSYTRSPRERRSAPYHRPAQKKRYSYSAGHTQELGTEWTPSISACRWEGSNDVFRQRFPEDKFASWNERRAAHLSRPIPRVKNFGSSSTLRNPERFDDNDFALEGMALFENRSGFDSDRFSGRGFSNNSPSPFALEGREHELRRNYEGSVNPEIDRLPQRTEIEQSATEISNSTCRTDLPNVETESSDRQKWPSTIQSWPSARQNAISNRQRETPTRQKVITPTRRNEQTRKQKEPPTRQIEHSTRQSKPSTQQSGSSTVQNVSSTRQSGSSTVQSVSSTGQSGFSTVQSVSSARQRELSIKLKKSLARQNGSTTKQNGPSTTPGVPSTRKTGPSIREASSNKQNEPTTKQNGPSTTPSVPSTRKTGGPSIRKTGPSIREVSSNKQNEPTTKQNGPSTTPSVPSTRKNGPSIRKTGPSIREVSSNKQNEPTTKQNGPSNAQCEPSTEKIGPPIRPVSSAKQNGPSTTPRRSCTRPNGPSTRQDGPSTRRDGPPIIRDGPSLRQSNEPSTRQSEPSTMPNVPPTGKDKVGSTSQKSVELQMAVSSEKNYQSQVKMKDIASVAVTENSSERFGESVDCEKTLTGDNGGGSSALLPETPRERTGVVGTGITGSDGSNRNISAIAKTPCVETVSRVVGREKVICQKETLGDSRESTAATVPQVSMRHVINTPKEAGISSKKDKNHGGSDNKQPTITDGLSASARARVDLSANGKDLQGSGVRTAARKKNSSAASNAGSIENNLSTIQSLSVSADKSSDSVRGSSQAPIHEVPTHCSPDLGKDKEPSATEGSSLRMSDVSRQKPQSGTKSANSSRQGNVPNHSSRGDADSVSSDKPSSSNAPLCGKTTNMPSATCKLITAYIRGKSLGNKSSDNNILIPDLIQKHVEKLQRYRSAQPNLTSARVQHHPSQHLDLALSDLKHVLLHLFEQPVSNHRKKLQEAQLKKLFANASKSSERFKRFGVHLESLDPDDSEMIKMLERLTEEDLELLSKEDSKEDLQELLSLFELAEEPPPSSGNSQATMEGRDGGQMRHRVIGNGSSVDAERRKDPETTSPAGASASDDSSSDVELIESVQMEIVVSSESEEEEDEVTKLPTLPTLPTSQKLPSEEADNSLHGQVFQLSLKETEFQQQYKAIRKEQKVLEERIKSDNAKVISLKKTKVEMKKKMKLLRKNRLKLTKGHTTLPQPAINTVAEGGSLLSSRNSLIDMAVAGAQQQNESSIRSMPLTSQEVLLPHSGSGSGLTTTQIITAGNVHMMHQASPSSLDPTVPRDLDASDTSVSQAPNQMFKQFTIPPSAMGISIQRLSNEDLLMLAGQRVLNSAQTSQVPSSFMFGVTPNAQITSNAMAAPSDQSGRETPHRIEGLRPQGVGIGPVGSLGVEKGNKRGLGNALQPSQRVGTMSQTSNSVGPRNAHQQSKRVGTMTQTPNVVGPANALKPSKGVGTMSQTPNVVRPVNAPQPSKRVGTMLQTPNVVGPVNAPQPSKRVGTMSQTSNSVGPRNALQQSKRVGTMTQTPNVVGPANALQPSKGVGTMSQTPNVVGPVNAPQPSKRVGTMSQTPNVVGPVNALQPSKRVGTMSQTPNVVGPGNALQPSKRVGTMSQTPNVVGPVKALQPSKRVGNMSQTPNSVGLGNALQQSKRVGTMSQTPNSVGPGNALQQSKRVGTMSQTPNAVGPANALQPSQRVGTMSQTPNAVGPGNALQPSQRVGTMSQTPNVVGPVNAPQPSQRIGTMSQTPNVVGPVNAPQPSKKVGIMSQTPNAVGPVNALQPSKRVGTMSQTPNAVGPGNALQPSKRVGTMSQTPNAVGPGNALQPSQRVGTMSQTPNAVGPGNALQPSQRVGTISQTPNVVGPGNALQPSQGVATPSQAHKAVGPGNAQEPSQGIGSLIPLTLTPQVTSSSSYGGQLPVTSSRESALAQSVPGSSGVDIPYPVSISKVTPTATSLEGNPPQILQEEGHQGVIIITEPEADPLVETERSEERPQPSSEHEMTVSTRSPSDQIPARSDSNQPTPEEYDSSPKRTQLNSRRTFVKQYGSKRKCKLTESQLPARKRLNIESKERKGEENDVNGSKMQLKVLLKSCLPKGQRRPSGSGVVANSFDSNSHSQGMEDEIPVTSEYSLRSVGSRRNADVLDNMRRSKAGRGRTKPRRTAPAPNLKKSQIRPKRMVNDSSGVENSNKQSGESQEAAGSPFSFDNLQKQIQEQGERERQLEVYRSQMVKKHMKTIQRYQRLGLSEFYIQIARKGTLASRAETVMLRNEAKRMRQLTKGSGQTIVKPIVKPKQQPAKDKSLLQKGRRLRRQARNKRKEAEKLELYKSIGMPAEFVAIMAKGHAASKEEQNALIKESKNYSKQYLAGRKALRKEKKLHRRKENQERLRLRSTARKQFKDLILPSLSKDRTIKTEGAGHQSQPIENVWSPQKMADNLTYLPSNQKTANAVIGLSVTDDKIYTYTVDGTIRFYRLQNLSCEGSYSGHEKRITGLHLCQDPEDRRSRLLFTSSRDQQLQCRVLCDGEPTLLSLDLRHPITCMAATSGSLYLGLANGHVDVLSIQSFKRYESFVCHNKEIGCVTIAEINYEKYLVTGAYDAKLAIHSIASGSLHGTLEGHASSILCVKAAGKFIISGSVDSVLLQHDFLTRRLMKRYNHHTKAITDISVHRSKIYTACLDDKVRIFDFHKMELVTTIDVENVLSLCNNKQTVYVGTTDGKVKKLSSLNVTDDKHQEDQ